LARERKSTVFEKLRAAKKLIDALAVCPGKTYVFSAFFAFSSAKELFSAATAGSAPAVAEAALDDVVDLFETAVVDFFVDLKDLPNMARKPA